MANYTTGDEAMEDSNRDRAFHDERRSEMRASPRVKVKVPVELYGPNSDVPLRGATSDLSETGCYIESIFPFPVGTPIEMSLELNETVLALGTAVTCDPQVGNGIKFTKMLPDDREQLRTYIEAAEQAKDEP
jgi:hypothetical protein